MPRAGLGVPAVFPAGQRPVERQVFFRRSSAGGQPWSRWLWSQGIHGGESDEGRAAFRIRKRTWTHTAGIGDVVARRTESGGERDRGGEDTGAGACQCSRSGMAIRLGGGDRGGIHRRTRLSLTERAAVPENRSA